MELDLNVSSHIKSADGHFNNMSRIRGLMHQTDLEKLVHAFTFSSLEELTAYSQLCPQKKKNSRFTMLSLSDDLFIKYF